MLGLTLGDKRTTTPRPEIYPQNLLTQYSVVWVLKNSKGVVGLFKFHNRRKFFSLIKKLSTIWSNLTLHRPFLPLPEKSFLLPSVWPSREYIWALIPKNLSDFFLTPYSQRHSRNLNLNVKFKMWPALFYANSLFSQNCLNVGVKLYIISPNLHRDWKLGFWMLLQTGLPNFSHHGR